MYLINLLSALQVKCGRHMQAGVAMHVTTDCTAWNWTHAIRRAASAHAGVCRPIKLKAWRRARAARLLTLMSHPIVASPCTWPLCTAWPNDMTRRECARCRSSLIGKPGAERAP